MKPYDTIMVATDLTETSQQAMEYAFEAARVSNARLVVLHVIEGTPADRYLPENFDEYTKTLDSYWLDPYTLSLFSRRQALCREREEKRAFIENQIPFNLKKSSEVIISIGDPLTEVIATAAQVKADVLVVGSHQRKGVAHVVHGSLSEKLIRKCSSPVLVVGSQARKEALAEAA